MDFRGSSSPSRPRLLPASQEIPPPAQAEAKRWLRWSWGRGRCSQPIPGPPQWLCGQGGRQHRVREAGQETLLPGRKRITVQVGTSLVPDATEQTDCRRQQSVSGYGSPEMKAAAATASEGCREINTQEKEEEEWPGASLSSSPGCPLNDLDLQSRPLGS